MREQLTFDGTPGEDPDASIQERFERFHRENPWVYERLRDLARQALHSRHGRIGIGMLYEVLRWETFLQTTGEQHKLNNIYRSRYARLLMEQEPELAGIFETRTLLSACSKARH